LIIPGLAWGAAWAVAAAVEAEPPPVNPLLPALISGLLAGMLEEFGWSGFAFPALQACYGFLRAGRYDLKLWIGSGDGSAAYLPG
jgi:membrane protease YdiL (CAAX protease family)